MNETAIFEKLGKLLWGIMPDDADEIWCIGMIYDASWSLGPEWRLKDGSVSTFTEHYPMDWCRDFYALMEELKRTSGLRSEPWNHFHASLNEKGKFKINFAYIPEGDSWAGLYMKGVSDLTREEAKANYIPEKDWADRVKKYKGS